MPSFQKLQVYTLELTNLINQIAGNTKNGLININTTIKTADETGILTKIVKVLKKEIDELENKYDNKSSWGKKLITFEQNHSKIKRIVPSIVEKKAVAAEQKANEEKEESVNLIEALAENNDSLLEIFEKLKATLQPRSDQLISSKLQKISTLIPLLSKKEAEEQEERSRTASSSSSFCLESKEHFIAKLLEETQEANKIIETIEEELEYKRKLIAKLIEILQEELKSIGDILKELKEKFILDKLINNAITKELQRLLQDGEKLISLLSSSDELIADVIVKNKDLIAKLKSEFSGLQLSGDDVTVTGYGVTCYDVTGDVKLVSPPASANSSCSFKSESSSAVSGETPSAVSGESSRVVTMKVLAPELSEALLITPLGTNLTSGSRIASSSGESAAVVTSSSGSAVASSSGSAVASSSGSAVASSSGSAVASSSGSEVASSSGSAVASSSGSAVTSSSGSAVASSSGESAAVVTSSSGLLYSIPSSRRSSESSSTSMSELSELSKLSELSELSEISELSELSEISELSGDTSFSSESTTTQPHEVLAGGLPITFDTNHTSVLPLTSSSSAGLAIGSSLPDESIEFRPPFETLIAGLTSCNHMPSSATPKKIVVKPACRVLPEDSGELLHAGSNSSTKDSNSMVQLSRLLPSSNISSLEGSVKGSVLRIDNSVQLEKSFINIFLDFFKKIYVSFSSFLQNSIDKFMSIFKRNNTQKDKKDSNSSVLLKTQGQRREQQVAVAATVQSTEQQLPPPSPILLLSSLSQQSHSALQVLADVESKLPVLKSQKIELLYKAV